MLYRLDVASIAVTRLKTIITTFAVSRRGAFGSAEAGDAETMSDDTSADGVRVETDNIRRE
ncbi:MAG: hypothetical protein QOH05_1893 [Acetobacteraceae bacterium]|jgi:hypothetical protein|nr:hypothetical protein [Acetobacteraceae bacterium]